MPRKRRFFASHRRRNASLPPLLSKNNAEEVLRRGAIETSRPAARPASNALINFAAMACSLCGR